MYIAAASPSYWPTAKFSRFAVGVHVPEFHVSAALPHARWKGFERWKGFGKAIGWAATSTNSSPNISDVPKEPSRTASSSTGGSSSLKSSCGLDSDEIDAGGRNSVKAVILPQISLQVREKCMHPSLKPIR